MHAWYPMLEHTGIWYQACESKVPVGTHPVLGAAVVGAAVGYRDGSADGLREGGRLGDGDGSLDGADVGMADVGGCDGVADGCAVPVGGAVAAVLGVGGWAPMCTQQRRGFKSAHQHSTDRREGG